MLQYFKLKTKAGIYDLAVFSRKMAGFQTKERKLGKQEIHSLVRRFEMTLVISTSCYRGKTLSYSPQAEESHIMRIKINHLIA